MRDDDGTRADELQLPDLSRRDHAVDIVRWDLKEGDHPMSKSGGNHALLLLCAEWSLLAHVRCKFLRRHRIQAQEFPPRHLQYIRSLHAGEVHPNWDQAFVPIQVHK